jgi:hypothetical protein|eukprot:SAG25_NODE_1184_length_3667_cov_11.095852_2_plen_136_part_00
MKLWEAAKAGDEAALRTLLDSGLDPNDPGQADQPVRFAACQHFLPLVIDVLFSWLESGQAHGTAPGRSWQPCTADRVARIAWRRNRRGVFGLCSTPVAVQYNSSERLSGAPCWSVRAVTAHTVTRCRVMWLRGGG